MDPDPFSASLTLLTSGFSLRELHTVAKQNLIASTQESIARQLSAWSEDSNDSLFGKEASCGTQHPNDKLLSLPLWNDDLFSFEGWLPEAQTYTESTKCDVVDIPSSSSTASPSSDLDHSVAHPTVDSNATTAAEETSVETTRPDKVLVCSEPGCGRKFMWRAHLRYHQQAHMGNKPHICEVADCGRKFVTAQQLAVHARTHSGERPFTCEQCGSGFTTAGNLRNHCRSRHTGERPFACSQPGCEKRFAERSSLKKHILVHTGEKPFKCQFCGKGFSQSSCRSMHIKKFHQPSSAGLCEQKANSIQEDSLQTSAQ